MAAKKTPPTSRAKAQSGAAKNTAPKPAPTAHKRAAKAEASAHAPRKRAQAPSAKAKQAPRKPADGERIRELERRLGRAVPSPTCELRFHDAFGLLIATILSAQSTDKMVNSVMPALLARFPDARALAAADQDEVESLVKRTGFFRNKAKAIRGASQLLVDRFGGEVPRTLEELVELPGVARKTANVVLGTAYRIPTGVVVDTHVTRVAERLALSHAREAAGIEQDLMAHFAQEHWIDVGHSLVLHGRYTCVARKPLCPQCPLNELCPSHEAPPDGRWQERAEGEAQRIANGFATSGPA